MTAAGKAGGAKPRETLLQTLRRIDGRGYKAYKDIQGAYDLGGVLLFIDHVQGDPFAAPSHLRLRMPRELAGIPEHLDTNRVRTVAAEDYLARQVYRWIGRVATSRGGSGKSGNVSIDAGRQEVIERTAVRLTPHWVEARIQVGLPADGRKVRGHHAAEILTEQLPEIARQSLAWANLPREEAERFVDCLENREAIRTQLDELGCVAFVPDGAVLPRESGASERPMSREKAVPFRSPPSFRRELALPHPAGEPYGPDRTITGMAVPEGVTLIVGGGFHGKSTLLEALSHGIYPHIPGDGREYAVTRNDGVKIRAEDGRSVAGVDISPFINHLPGRQDTGDFSTEDASGSTSQAASIVEAMEAGSKLLLIDEDTSATNFMIRDARMQRLVHSDEEPITPFVDRVRELSEQFGVSTVLVMGGCGDYFDTADQVIMMKEYLPEDKTAASKEIAAARPSERMRDAARPLEAITRRIPLPRSVTKGLVPKGRKPAKIKTKGLDEILFGREVINLRLVEQLADPNQAAAVAQALSLLADRILDGTRTTQEALEAFETLLDSEGVDTLGKRQGEHPGNYVRPRGLEVAAALNRLRTLQVTQR